MTPLFLGGAEPRRPELRTASFKGAIQFWWRALQECASHDELRQREADLFGSSEAGRSRISLEAEWNVGFRFPEAKKAPILSPGRAYLAGQGLWDRGQLTRGFAEPGGTIIVRAILHQLQDDGGQELEGVLNAFRALGLLGGLGSRSRRGFGSIRLDSLIWSGGSETGPESIAVFQQRVSKLLTVGRSRYLPEYTAFSSAARSVILESKTSAEEIHEAIGKRFHDSRSCLPFDRRVRPTSLATEDLAAVRGWLEGRKLAEVPARAVFGLPHNYFFPQGKTSVGLEPTDSGKGRRASPLFFHVDEVGDAGKRHGVVVVTFLPAAFLPAGETITIKVGGRSQAIAARTPLDLWKPITNFLDDLVSRPPEGLTARRVV